MAEAEELATPLPVGRKPRRDDEFVVTIERLDARGGALGHWGEFRVHLRHALPGSTLRASVLRRRGERIEARVLEELEPSPHAVEPRCAHFASCGGCSFQDLDYAFQLEHLGRVAKDLLEPLATHGGPFPIDPVIPCETPFAYRNKMDFTFSDRRWIEEGEGPDARDDGFALGLHAPGRYEKVLDVGRCDIQFEEGNAILSSVRRLAKERGLEPWANREHTGLLRHLVLRKGFATGEIMVNLVTSEEAAERVDPFAAALLAEHPEIHTLVQNVNTRAAAIAVGEFERVLHGEGVIHEELAGLRFAISANSFFQTNTRQAEVLVSVVREELLQGGSPGGVLYDVYSGAGVLTLALAPAVGEAIGFEKEPSAVADARRNAERNGVANARFVEGDVLETLAQGAPAHPAPDAIVLDPPRAGMHPKVAGVVGALAPQRLVYVSCHLASAVRDLEPFLLQGYRLVRVRPLDMFPHTPHLETVLTLEKGPQGG